VEKYSDKITRGYRPSKESHYALRNMELSRYRWRLDNIVQHTNRYILLEPNLSRECDAKIEIIALICRLFLAGALRSNKQSLEELWGTDGNGLENFGVVMNCRHLKFLIRCTLE